MELIFWAGLLSLAGLGGVITLYLNLLHGDLKRGAITTFEITDAVTTYFPIEIAIQIALSILLLVVGDTFIFLLTVPMLLYNIKALVYKEYRCHALFSDEYAKKESVEIISKVKTIFYCSLMVYLCIRFFACFVDFVDQKLNNY